MRNGWRAVKRWDHWHEPLQTAVSFISLWQKALIDKPQQAAGHLLCCFILSSPVWAWAGPSAAERLWDDATFFAWRKKMPREDAMGGPLDKPIQRLGSTLSRIHFVHVLLAGELEVARTVDFLQLLMVRNGHIPSTQLGDLLCRHFPSPDPQILQLPSSSSSSSSPLWHWSQTPMGHTVGNEIKTGICKDDAFLESLIGQMLSWESGHLFIQALPVQQVIAKRERVTIWDFNPKTQGHSILLSQKKTWKRKWQMMFLADIGTSKSETSSTACTAKDFFALPADINKPESQQNP